MDGALTLKALVGSVILSRQLNNASTGRVGAVVSGRTWCRIIITKRKRGIYSPSERGGNSHGPVRPTIDDTLSSSYWFKGHWPFPQTLQEQEEEQAQARQNFKNAFPFSRTDAVQEQRTYPQAP
jgi:hypothetical protein